MITEAEARQALRQVMDPELRKSIVELGMLRQVEIAGDTIDVTLALTTMACPLRNRMGDDIVATLQAVAPGAQVKVHYVEMTAEEKRNLLGGIEPDTEPSPASRLNQIARVVAVMSGKGGVGKSSMAALLAVALRRAGYRVGVLDADITGPSIPRMFGVRGPAGMSPLGVIPASSAGGVALMSINLLLEREDQAVIWRGPLVSSAIRQFWDEVVWGDLDVLVVDLPPGTSDASLTVLQSLPVDGVVMVTSPQELAGMVVRKAAQMAAHLDRPLIGLVENMSYFRCPACGEETQLFGPSHGEAIAAQLGTHLLGRLPIDPEMATLGDAGKIEQYAGEAFEPVAEHVIEALKLRC